MRLSLDLLENDDDALMYENLPVTGVVFDTYPDGVLSYEASFKNGFPHGCVREWYQNGQIKTEKMLSRGVAHGAMTFWYPNGAVHILSEYEFGIETKYVEWAEDGIERVNRTLGPESGVNYAFLLETRESAKDPEWRFHNFGM